MTATAYDTMNHVVLYGADEFQLERALKSLRDTVVDANFGALGHKVLTNPSLADIIEALSTVAFSLGGRTVIEFHNPACLASAAKDETAQKQLDHIKSLVENPSGATLFVWVATKLDARIGFPKWLLGQKKHVHAEKFEPFKFWQSDEVKRFLAAETKKNNIDIEDDALSELVNSWGVELRLLLNEIEKLAVYALGRCITRQDVLALSHHHETLFRMIDNWLVGRLSGHDLEALEMTLLSQHPVAIFALTQGYLNNLFRPAWYAQRYKMSPEDIAHRTGQKPFSVRKNLDVVRGVPLKRLVALKRKLLECEWKTKTGQLDGKLALELLLAS
jgi:DNA polymerase III subunit delta